MARTRLEDAAAGGFRPAVAALTLLLSGVQAARADVPVAPFRLTQLAGYAEMGVLDRSERRSREGIASRADADELKIDQLLHLDLGGYVYHPRFLRFRGSTELQVFEEPREKDVRLLTAGSWNLSFLEQHPVNFSVFGNVRETEVERTFSRTFDLRSELYGATFRVRRSFLPFELSYDHRSIRRRGTGSDLDEAGDDFSFLGRYEIGERSSGRVEYYGTVEEVQDRDIFRQRIFASNATTLDDAGRIRLRGNVRYRQQRDESNRSATSAFTGLDWRHSDRLATRYRLEYQRSDTESQSSNNWNLGATLRHQLFESLSTTADVYGRLEGASFGKTRTAGGSFREEYTKRLASWGRLNIGFRPSIEWIERRPTQTSAFSVDERAVLPLADPVELVQRDVDPATIVVTNSSGSIVYVENFDYRIEVRGRLTELFRIPTGDIAADETVLVDYLYQLPGRGDILSRGITADVDVSVYETLTLYFRVLSTKQSLLSGQLDTDLETRNRLTAGVKLSRSWMRARVEVEQDRSTFRSFRAVSEFLSLFTPGRSWWRARLSGSHRYQAFEHIDERVNRIAASATLALDVTRRGILELGADTQWEKWKGDDSSSFRNLSAYGGKATFTWRFRSFRVLLGGSVSRVDRHGQQEDADRVFLRLRREF